MTVTDIAFAPLVAPWLVAALGGLVALAVLIALWRRLPGWWLRAAGGLVLMLALANPSIRQEERTPLSDIVLVVIDRTASQQIGGRAAQTDAALSDLRRRLAEMEGIETREITVTDAPPDSDAGTLLMTALSGALGDLPRGRIAGVIVISDGQVHDMELAPDLPAPMQLLLTGRRSDWDRRLVVTSAPAFGILDEPVPIRLRIEDRGAVPQGLGGTTTLTVTIDGGRPIELPVRIGRTIDLPVKLPHAGRNVLQFSVPALDGEVTGRNNAAVVTVNGVRDRLRVLLVSGEPHAGERTWRNLLKSDSSVDLVHFTILRPPGKQDGVPVNELSLIAFPTRELFMDRIDDFDLIIFDRYRLRGILPAIYLDNIARYVEQGGAVLVAAGPAFAGVESIYRSPLARILPGRPTKGVFERGFLPRISALGARHPVTAGLERFAPRPPGADGTPGWGRWFRMIDVEPVAGDVVMTGPKDRPLLILNRVGKGRVALLASDQAWLWDRGFEGGGPQLELLRRLAHWMMGEPELAEEALTATARGREVTVERRSLKEGARSVTVLGPGGETSDLPLTEVAPGRWQGRFTGRENGLYRLKDDALETVIALGPAAPREFEDAIATGAVLAPLVEAKRGGVLRIEDGLPTIRRVREGRVAAGRGWIGITPRNASVTTDIRLTPLAPALLFLLLAAGLTLLAWRREGR